MTGTSEKSTMTVDIIAGWLNPEETIGTLDVRTVHGHDITSVSLCREWLDKHGNILIDPKIIAFTSAQYPENKKDTFGFLSDAVKGYELSAQDETFLKLLIDAGSSLGGARPKTNIIDPDGQLWIAKFPSQRDKHDVGAWEMTEHDLAVLCGLNVPDARLLRLSDNRSTFLSKRFDRENGTRIHMMSMMTVLSLTDGHTEGTGYIDMAGQLEMMSASPQHDLRELWKRMAFNVLTSNCDDHPRNHGLILRKDGWHLSPAYDLNPMLGKDSLSLNITDHDSTKNIQHVIDVAELFRIRKSEARDLAGSMQEAIRSNWRRIAKRYRLSGREIHDMAPAFAECERHIEHHIAPNRHVHNRDDREKRTVTTD